jgi:hypothetical protein
MELSHDTVLSHGVQLRHDLICLFSFCRSVVLTGSDDGDAKSCPNLEGQSNLKILEKRAY